VIADTGPVNYLILIGHVDVLPRLFDRVVLPSTVQTELSSEDAPLAVQSWIKNPPAWLEINDAPAIASPAGIHKGEAAAIALASSMGASFIDRRPKRRSLGEAAGLTDYGNPRRP
jgi:predicted nucleic acid-binding protein